MKTVFVAHPIDNFDMPIDKLAKKVFELDLKCHFIGFSAWNNTINIKIDGKNYNIDNNLIFLLHSLVDEIWLVGTHIDEPTKRMIYLAYALRVKIIPKTIETQEAYNNLGLIETCFELSSSFWKWIIIMSVLVIFVSLALFFFIQK